MKIYIIPDIDYCTIITKKGCSILSGKPRETCEEIVKRITPRDKVILCKLPIDAGRCYYYSDVLKLHGINTTTYPWRFLDDYLPKKMEEE